ncbi:MAG: beta-ketoacyl synthase N-terminal-like domain-containing protein, partial [Acidaminococcaceae bacterium]
MKKRVVITGLGAVTPIGIGKNEFWNNLIAGKSGVGPITQFDTTDFDVRIAGEVKDFDYTQFIDKKEGKRMDRVTQFAVAAAKLAVEDAKLDHATIDPCRAGVCVGSGIGGIHTFLEQS